MIQLVRGPSGPASRPGRLGRDPLRGKIGQGGVQRLDLDDEMAEAGAEVGRAPAGSCTSSMVTKPSPGSRMVRLPEAVPSTVPTTVADGGIEGE